MFRILSMLLAFLSITTAQNLKFYQNDYDVKMDIAKCPAFNSSVYKYWKLDFVFYNRTTKVLNASIELLVDLKSDQILHIQVYKFMSSEYRFFPVTVSVNACAEYARNTFKVRDIFLKASNINPCNLKRGFYYIRNARPDFSTFPPHMPSGMYKMEVVTTYHTYNLYTLEFYGEIKDKPIDWINIPKQKWV